MNHSEQQHRRPGRGWARPILGLLTVVALLVTGAATGASQGPGPAAPEPDSASSNPKLEWSLNQLLYAYDRAGALGAEAFSATGAVDVEEGRVMVTIHAEPQVLEELAASLPDLGGEVRSQYGQRLVARVPIDALEPLAAREEIELITEPRQPVLLEPELAAGRYTSEGVAASNATAWHTAGNLGAGVRIAIIDAGFSGYASLLGSDLPATVATYDWTGSGIGGTPHGTACAEIVHDMAPQASLYLHKVNYNTDVGQAVDRAIADGVDVISMSLGWTIDGPGDGTGFLADIVKRARQNGIFFATAAGNEADETWHGAYQDDGSDRHRWAQGEWINEFTDYINAGQAIRIGLHWDDWSRTGQDYDLELYRWTGSSWTLETASRNRQSAGYATPEEFIGIYAPTSGTYGLAVRRYSASRNVCFRVLAPKMGALEHFSTGRSLTFPADSTNAASGAALDASAPYPLESYSSRGPTFGPGGACSGGATKPDLGGYANVSTASYGPTYFNGTSSATPHLAGAAALVKGAFPTYSPAQVQAFLEQRAADQGPAGKDNAYGAGRLNLGTPPNGGNTPPILTGLPDQTLPMGASKDRAIDLWAYASDAQSRDDQLIYTIHNAPEPSAGVSIVANRYVTIRPASGWTGQTLVTVRVADPGGLSGADTFRVMVTEPVVTWTGASSADWHEAGNWSPRGVPTAGDNVLIPATARAPVVASGIAAARNLTIDQGAVLDLGNRGLTIEQKLTNAGTLKQTLPVAGSGTTSFLRIRNQAGDQTRYYGLDLTPTAGTARVADESAAGQPALLAAPDPASAGAPPASTLGQTVLTSIADSGLLKGYPTTNYGGVWTMPDLSRPTGMMWAGYDTYLEPDGKVARSLLRFDDTDLPDGAEIGQATLRLYLVVSYGAAEDSLEVTAYRATADWSEDTVTWSNAPGYAGAAGSQSIPHGAWGWYDFDVTEMVRAWHDRTSTNHGIYLLGQEESELGWRGFATREEATAPQLIVQHSDPANAAPVLNGLPDQTLQQNGALEKAIDLWQHASDAEDGPAGLLYAIDNAPNPGAGVGLSANRYVDINSPGRLDRIDQRPDPSRGHRRAERHRRLSGDGQRGAPGGGGHRRPPALPGPHQRRQPLLRDRKRRAAGGDGTLLLCRSGSPGAGPGRAGRLPLCRRLAAGAQAHPLWQPGSGAGPLCRNAVHRQLFALRPGHAGRRRQYPLPVHRPAPQAAGARRAGPEAHRQRRWQWQLHRHLAAIRRRQRLHASGGRQYLFHQPNDPLCRPRHLLGCQQHATRLPLLPRPGQRARRRQRLEQPAAGGGQEGSNADRVPGHRGCRRLPGGSGPELWVQRRHVGRLRAGQLWDPRQLPDFPQPAQVRPDQHPGWDAHRRRPPIPEDLPPLLSAADGAAHGHHLPRHRPLGRGIGHLEQPARGRRVLWLGLHRLPGRRDLAVF